MDAGNQMKLLAILRNNDKKSYAVNGEPEMLKARAKVYFSMNLMKNSSNKIGRSEIKLSKRSSKMRRFSMPQKLEGENEGPISQERAKLAEPIIKKNSRAPNGKYETA